MTGQCSAELISGKSSDAIWPIPAWVIHLLFAVFLFSPFLLEGRVLLASTDNFFHYIPNMLFSLRTIQQGDLGLWNPFILGGVDFAGSAHNHVYAPLNWPLFMLPESWMLPSFTARVLLEVWLVGLCAYLFLREEIGNAKWALFGSLVYQAGGFTFFSMTTYSATQFYFLVPLALYLLWTVQKRPPWRTYCFLTLITATVLLSGNIVYSFATVLTVVVVFAYRWLSGGFSRRIESLWIFCGALFTAVLLSAIHWVPIFFALLEGARASHASVRLAAGQTILGFLPAFVPESLGIDFAPGRAVYRAFGGGGAHSQFHALNYFGVLPVLLILISPILRIRAARFWVVYLLINVSWFLSVQPFSAMLDLLASPLIHRIIPKMLIPLGIAVVAATVGKNLQESPKEPGKHVLWGLISIMAVVFFMVTGAWTWALKLMGKADALSLGRPLAIFGAVAILAVGYAMLSSSPKVRRIGVVSLIAALLAAFFAVWGIASRYGLSGDASFRSAATYIVLTGALAVAILLIQEFSPAIMASRRFLTLIWSALAAIILILAVVHPVGQVQISSVPGLPVLGGLGLIKFLAMGFACVSTLALLGKVPAVRNVFPVLMIVLLLIDLLPYNKNYTRQISSIDAFQKAGSVYKTVGDSWSQPKPVVFSDGPNLMVNGSFENWDPKDMSPGPDWHRGGVHQTLQRVADDCIHGKASIALSNNSSAEISNLFQDYVGDQLAPNKAFTFGAWIKRLDATKGTVHVQLTDGHIGANGPKNLLLVKGDWQWLSITLITGPTPEYVRPHISLEGPINVLVDGAILVEGEAVDLYRSVDIAKRTITAGPAKLNIPNIVPINRADMRQYRLASAHAVLFDRLGLHANLPMVHKVRICGGVNSDAPQDLLTFLHTLDPNMAVAASGVASNPSKKILLDLMGCGYDQSGSPEYLTVRPSALSRFALFNDFRNVETQAEALRLLGQEGFVARKQLLVTGELNIDPSQQPQQSVMEVPFEEVKTSHIKLSVDAKQPAVLFFGDTYHRGWKVFVDGEQEPLLRTDYLFMGVAVPKGRHEVVFRFRPRSFSVGVNFSIIGLLLLVANSAGMMRFGRRDQST